jgi:nitrogen fixation protein FixH
MRISLNWGTGIALVYTAFAAATTGFVTFAMSRTVHLVSDDYYAQSLQQNQRMEAERNTRALVQGPSVGWSGAHAMVLSLPSAHAPSATGTVTLYRPSDAAADRTFALAVDAAGRQQIPLDALARGRWLLQVRWSAEGRSYYFEEPVIVP